MKNITLSTQVFAALIVITLLSSLGVEASVLNADKAAVLIITAAIVKILLVLYFFMGIRDAHIVIRVLTLIWAICLGLILVSYS